MQACNLLWDFSVPGCNEEQRFLLYFNVIPGISDRGSRRSLNLSPWPWRTALRWSGCLQQSRMANVGWKEPSTTPVSDCCALHWGMLFHGRLLPAPIVVKGTWIMPWTGMERGGPIQQHTSWLRLNSPRPQFVR